MHIDDLAILSNLETTELAQASDETRNSTAETMNSPGGEKGENCCLVYCV